MFTCKLDFDEVIRSGVLEDDSLHGSRPELEANVTRCRCIKRRKFDRGIFLSECNDVLIQV